MDIETHYAVSTGSLRATLSFAAASLEVALKSQNPGALRKYAEEALGEIRRAREEQAKRDEAYEARLSHLFKR